MKGYKIALATLLSLWMAARALSQSTYATVSGTIEDATGALIPGVTVTATNTATGVVTTVLSNESGAYSFSSLLPGPYKVSAELSGFQTQSYTDVRLGNAEQVRLNFTLRVGGVNTAVEVTVAVDTLLAVSSSSVGEVISQQRVTELPTVTNNVLDLYRLIPGIRLTDDAGNNGSVTGLGGLGTVNITRDGVDNVGAARFGVSLQGATYMSPDLISEVRIITAPVDAELGRGNGQFQFMTRSGSNQFHGTGVWTVRNTAFDANTWNNNRQVDPKTGAWKPTPPDWANNHQFTASYGGPIVKNKTFFFALWDSTLINGRNTTNPVVLTPCARKGIFRYFDNWNNGNTVQALQATGATPTIAVVDGLGNPLTPANNPNVAPFNGSSFTGSLHYVSVFGTVLNPTTVNSDCSNVQVGPAQIGGVTTANGAWDTFRTGIDTTGFVTKLLGKMPLPNNYEVGDGLNTAGHRWTRNESSGSEGIFAVGPGISALTGAGRKQINTKIDHNFNSRHKVAVSYTYENTAGNANYEPWPGGFRGKFFRHPQTLAVNFTSTLSPTLVNEARTGMRRIGGNTLNAFNNPGTGEAALAFFPNYGGYPLEIGLGTGATGALPFQTNQVFNGTTDNYHDITNLWSFTDSLSWTRGKHAFKFGGEIRLTHSLGYDAGISATNTTSIPRALGGDAPQAQIPTAAISSTNFPGLAGNPTTPGNNQRMRSLLSFLSGSLSQVNQFYYIQDPKKLDRFEDYLTYPERVRDMVQNEGDMFVKDDWKLTKDLTLNLGVRWEYYGVPYEAHGLMPLPVGGSNALFGISGRSFADWMKPGARADLTTIQFVGKHSPNPDIPWYANDYNNFGPAVGFAWQLPWFGQGKTTVRGGYQMTFQQGQVPNALTQENNVPGSTNNARYTGDSGANAYLDLTKVPSLVPVPNIIKPMQPIPLTDRTQGVFIPENGVRNPYAENITLSVTRSVRPNLTVDLRYIGTLGRKQWNAFFNINQPNFLFNGLKEAFDAVRAGDDSSPALQAMERMLKGINLGATTSCSSTNLQTPCAPVGNVGSNGVLQTAGMHLRASTATAAGITGNLQSNLANGNYAAVAGILNVMNYTSAVNPTLPTTAAGINGAVLRNSGLFPENFIVTNPQFTSVNMVAAMSANNYHSMEAQVTMRETHGVSFQATYTWSRNTGVGGTYTNPVDRHADYTVLGDTRKHDFRTNGAFALPIGPNKLFFTNSSGVLARIIEGWHAGWIVNINSGAPTSITAQSMLYANGTPDIVGPFDPRAVGVQWASGETSGNYFAPGTLKTDKDPQCASVTSSQGLNGLCTLNAVFDTKTGQVLLQNPLPGRRGTLGQRALEVPGRYRFDANLRKQIKLRESKTMEFRMDVSNVFNHPEPANPVLDINNTNFGLITTVGATTAKSNLHRQFQAQLRLDF
jgi:Carboxypeptidase regulatory-like domain